MKKPQVSFSDLAVADILAQADWYELRADQTLATRWEQAVTKSVLHLVRAPLAGALCGFKLETLRQTRRWPITGFPSHLIFYKVIQRQVHVLRVLHGARDLEKLLSG